jgi:uncharacterized protein YceK
MVRILMAVVMVVGLAGCSSLKHMVGADQCTAPTPREAKITKKVWM